MRCVDNCFILHLEHVYILLGTRKHGVMSREISYIYSKVGQEIMIMVQLAQLKLQHVLISLARQCAVESVRQ